MKLKQKMFMKIFMKIKVYLFLATTQKIQIFMILSIEKVTGKMKDEFKGKIICESVGLKSKVYSPVTVDNEEIKKEKESIRMLLKI